MTSMNETALPVVVANDTRQGHVGCQAVMQSLSTILASAGMKPIHSQPAGTNWQEDDAFKAAAAKAGAIIINGEGTIHHSNPRAKLLARLGPYGRDLGIPVILVNATLAANDASIYDDLRQFSMVSVRDRASIAEAVSFGLPAPSYAPDLSFHHELFKERRGRPSAEEVVVAVTDSAMKSVSEKLIDFAKRRGYPRNLLRAPAGEPPITVRGYARSLYALNILFTGRYHSVCLAINAGCPFLAVESNTPKITSLLEDVFGSARRVISPGRAEKVEPHRFAFWGSAEQEALATFRKLRRDSYAALVKDMATTAKSTMAVPALA